MMQADFNSAPADADYILHGWKDGDNYMMVRQSRISGQLDGYLKDFQVIGRIWGNHIAINPAIPPAWPHMEKRLREWMEAGKAYADILLALGSCRAETWTGPAMKKNRQAALSMILGRKVKSTECGVNALVAALVDRIGISRDNCAATMNQELYAFLRIARAVCGSTE